MLCVKTIIMFDRAKILKIVMNVFLISYFENRIGINNPVMAIVNVKEDTYNPEIAIDILKYSDICDIIPIMLNGVLIAIVDNIKMYRNTFFNPSSKACAQNVKKEFCSELGAVQFQEVRKKQHIIRTPLIIRYR